MAHRILSLASPALAVAICLALPALVAAQGEVHPITAVDCAGCHEEVVNAFVDNPHASAYYIRESGRLERTPCEGCHGDAAEHMETGDPAHVLIPGRTGTEQMCLTCHTDDVHAAMMRTGAHGSRAVVCNDCHLVHQTRPRSDLLRAEADDLCTSCHPAAAADFRRPYAHRLDHGGLDCVSCHNPHAGTAEASLRNARTGEGPCITCHADKRGPFVFPHVVGVVRDDCTTCHDPHGATNPMQLQRANVWQLCIECHSDLGQTTLGSQPPSFHDLRSPRFRNCTTCHVAVHGSNSSPALLR